MHSSSLDRHAEVCTCLQNKAAAGTIKQVSGAWADLGGAKHPGPAHGRPARLPAKPPGRSSCASLQADTWLSVCSLQESSDNIGPSSNPEDKPGGCLQLRR